MNAELKSVLLKMVNMIEILDKRVSLLEKQATLNK